MIFFPYKISPCCSDLRKTFCQLQTLGRLEKGKNITTKIWSQSFSDPTNQTPVNCLARKRSHKYSRSFMTVSQKYDKWSSKQSLKLLKVSGGFIFILLVGNKRGISENSVDYFRGGGRRQIKELNSNVFSKSFLLFDRRIKNTPFTKTTYFSK